MQLVRGIHNLINQPKLKEGCVLAIGNFDGVHLGHQQILKRLHDKALALNVPSVVMIFEPQPREFFAKNKPSIVAPARLMRLRDKITCFSHLQIDFVICIRFNSSFSSQLPEQFINNILVEKLKVRYLSVGDDFHFGINRSGNFETLRKASQKFGFEIENSESHCLNKERISSSLIREALQSDDLSLAEKLLGKPYTICGRVSHGNKLGRTIGFPTANISLNRLVTPIQGVYSVRVKIENYSLNGIANVGNRPTVNASKPLLEVHIFDFEWTIYGKLIEVQFLKKIRAEVKFESFDMLKQQINLDIQQAKLFLNILRG